MNTIQEFQELLKNLFQFKSSDLDSKIHHILNCKRKAIKKFIEKDFVNKGEYIFAKYKDKRKIIYGEDQYEYEKSN